jgi:hypothetical protein
MKEDNKKISVRDICGEWKDPGFSSSLIERCKAAWNKPLSRLTNAEVASFLREKVALDYILPIARERIDIGFDDETELYIGELEETVKLFN